ncbi:unnamed protein product [Blepharisma stoltei]|uniref:Uncharacterized protein n=1 Tax=Blepharisma stoltei TaxID=1481888 RepID=A0AAU9K4L1_9CILI|nr:unnamed protein product [Blepharisma stoltei]
MSWARSLIDSDIASWIFSDECYVHLFRNSNLSWCKEGINATIELKNLNYDLGRNFYRFWQNALHKEGEVCNQCPGLYQRHSPGLYWAFRWRLHLRSGWGNSPYCKADYGILQRKRDWCEDSIAEEPRSQSNWDDLGQFEEESGEKKPDSKARLIAAIQESWDEISFEEVQNSILKVKNERARQVIEAQGEWS